MEPKAAEANEAVKRIDRWKKAASKLLSAQTEPGSTASIFYAEYLVQNEFPITLDQFHDLLMSYLGACTSAQSRAASKDEPEFRSGGSWDVWIRRLTAILKQHRLAKHRPPRCPLRRRGSPFPVSASGLRTARRLPGRIPSRNSLAESLGECHRSSLVGSQTATKSDRLRTGTSGPIARKLSIVRMVGHELGENTSQTTKADQTSNVKACRWPTPKWFLVLARPHCTKRSRAGA